MSILDLLILVVWLSMGLNGDPGGAILNCLLARQLCHEDTSCASILEVIPRVCGPELVACATGTVTRCQAGLRTLQAYPFFRPTCLCKEPHLDRDCNSFRDLLFDHPCMVATQREEDPYFFDALPTCIHALTVCQKKPECMKTYEEFKETCKARDGQCKTEQREACLASWSRLRFSPLFGCICPNNQMKKRCERIFSVINHNPCIGRRAPSLADLDASWENAVATLGGSNATSITSRNTASTAQVPMYQVTGVQPRWKNRTQASHTGTAQSNTQENEENTKVLSFQSTCHTALWRCQGNSTCGRHLDALLQHCDGRQCHRDLCMQALQGFYRDTPVEWSLEIAFCLCKKTDDKQDVCLVAQEKLHPDCARRVDTIPPKINPPVGGIGGGDGEEEEDGTDVTVPAPACHTLAEDCRAHPDCKPRLEFYEQACAVDALTRGCAGPPALCRLAMLGILGTELRTSCACRVGDLTAMYECLGWQRILWINPCVVESQRAYHKEQGNLVIATLTGTNQTIVTSTSHPSPGVTKDLMEKTTKADKDAKKTAGTSPAVFGPVRNGNFEGRDDASEVPPPLITETATELSTLPTRFCTAARPGSAVVLIPEGSGKRLFREDEPDCSELCDCKPGDDLKCSLLECIERKPCETPVAVYSHAGPAYRAYRGECLCYAGYFVCAKPDPDLYTVDVGVFLFVGYSKADEKLLHYWTQLTVQDHLMLRLQRLVVPVGNASACRLSIHEHVEENVILQARLEEYDEDRANHSLSLAKLQREIGECGAAMQRLARMINERDTRIHEDLLLSVIKVAEFNSYMPEPVRSLACQSVTRRWMVWISTLLVLSLRFPRYVDVT